MKTSVLFLLIALLSGCGPKTPQLNVLIWANDIDPKIVADFERQFDCKVVFDSFDDDALVSAKLAGGGVSIYDIVCTSNHYLPALAKQKLLAPLRREHLPNFNNLSPNFTNLEFDPGNRFSIPYEWVTVGLMMRRPPNTPVEESWALIFDPTKQPGPFVLVDEMKSCLCAALRYKGYSVNTTNVGEFTEVRDLLIAAKKRSLGFQVGTGSRNRVLSRGATLAITWNSKTAEDMIENPDIVFFIPREGSGAGIDCLSVTAEAPHRDLAEKFLNYLLEPQVALRTATFLGTPTLNQAARELLSPEVRNNPNIYPPPEVMRRIELSKDLGEMAKLHDEIWTQIKSR